MADQAGWACGISVQHRGEITHALGRVAEHATELTAAQDA